MISYPLTRPNRLRLARAFARVPRVDISIECALEDQMGSAFVDSTDAPTCFLIEQDGFFGYLAGDFSSDAGHDFLRKLPSGRLLMSGSDGWAAALQSVFGERLREIARTSYASDTLDMQAISQLAATNPHTPNVRRVDTALAESNSPFLQLGAFESAADFVERGIGFCLLNEGQIIGAVQASLVCSNAIEVSLVVDEQHQRKGIATALSCQLLMWCLERGIAPHWDAANEESCRLAEKLGYRREGDYMAYYLP